MRSIKRLPRTNKYLNSRNARRSIPGRLNGITSLDAVRAFNDLQKAIIEFIPDPPAIPKPPVPVTPPAPATLIPPYFSPLERALSLDLGLPQLAISEESSIEEPSIWESLSQTLEDLFGRRDTLGLNVMLGDNRRNVLYGLAGNDIISGKGGNDTIFGGRDTRGIDKDYLVDSIAANISGSTRRQLLFNLKYLSDGNDTLSVGAGRDRIFGERGNDLLLGGPDNDVLLSGGIGHDILVGYGRSR